MDDQPKKEDTEPMINEPRDSSRDIQIVETTPVPPKQRGPVTISTLNVYNAPMERFIAGPLRRRHDRHYHSRHRHGLKHLIADIVLASTVLVLLAFNVYLYAFRSPILVNLVRLTTTVTPEIVKSGDLVTLTIDYANDNTEALVDTTLAIQLPKTFQLTSATPSDFDRQHTTFSLGIVEPHAHGRVIVTGQFLGAVGSRETAGVAINYTPKSSGTPETKIEKIPIHVRDSALRVSIEFPALGVHEGDTPFIIRYNNAGQYDIVNVEIQPTTGSTLNVRTSSIPLTNGRFSVGTVPPNGSGTITGTISVFGGGEREAVMSVQCFVEQQQICTEETRGVLTLFYPSVTSRSLIDGSVEAPIQTDKPLHYQIEYTNNEAEDIINLSITIAPPTSFFVLDATTRLDFTPQIIPALAVIKKGGSGSVAVSLPIHSPLNRSDLFGNGESIMTIPYTVRYRLASHPDQEIVLHREDRRHVATDLSIDAFARYYTREGDQLGRGPLPPIVGDATRYWAFLSIANSFSDVADVIVRAHVPDHVFWTGKTSVTLGEPLQFDDRTRELTWRVGTVTRFTGGIYPGVGVALELSLTPESTHVGTSPILLDTITVQGKDTFTHTAIERAGPTVTTNLSVDPKAKGKGTVVAD